MAKQFTGIDGALYADGNKVARVSNWSFNATAAPLNTTTLGDFATTSIYGIQSFTGTCSVYYCERYLQSSGVDERCDAHNADPYGAHSLADLALPERSGNA